MSLDNKVVDLADLKVSHDYLLGRDELLSDRINELGSGIDGIQSQITALGNGSPIPVETVAEMTDNTKAYLYTGSEQGYTSGYWYTYDSTQAKFVPRGEYGAGVIIDSTLTVTGNAADAKATGDAIKAGKTFVVQVPGSAAVLSGSITAGDFAKALAAYTAGSGVYAVKDGEVYQLSAVSSSTMTFTQMYHGTMNFIKQIQITSADTFTVTNTALSSSATDTSYSNTASGLTATNVQAAIDENAAAISNTNENLNSNVFMARAEVATEDFNNYTKNGAYLVNSVMLNRPDTTEQGTLLVFAYNTTGNWAYVQIYVSNSTSRYFYRAFVNGTWKEWQEVGKLSALADMQTKNFTERTIATGDLNNYLVNGAYLVNSAVSNAPYASAKGLLNVFTWNQTNAYGLVQMFVPKDSSTSPYYRFKWNNVWSGWMTFAPQIDVNIVETAKNTNVLNPSNFTLNGFISSQDGTTFTVNNNYMCTNDFIDVPFGTQSIYAKFPQVDNNNRVCAFLYYDAEGNYTGSYSGRFDDSDVKIAALTGQIDVAKIKFWVNKTTVDGGSNDVCISFTEPSAYVAYEGDYKVEDESLENPQIYLPLSGKKIVCFGDSIFGNKRAPFGVTDELKEITGATVYNMGFGGTDMAARSSSNWDAFSMYRLAYSIANNDFAVQNAVDVDSVSGMPKYFKTSLALLKTIDFNDVDIITIAYGTNDFTGNIILDNADNLVDTTKFCGALRYSLQQIMSAFPHIKIFVCGQTYRFWLSSGNEFIDDSDTHENGNGNKLTDFVTVTERVSEEYHVHFIDNYFGLGINSYNRGYYFPANDGTHHNYKGAKLIAEHIKHELF